MPVDSTANLLFTIGANSDDAEGNIEAFRALLGKDLATMSAEFEAWATGIVGEIATVQGAMVALGAVTGAGLVAIAGFALEAAHKYSEFVDEVARGTKTTGLSMENMSKLKFAADVTNTSYEALTTGLTRFATNVVKAAQGSDQQMKSFAALGITQEQVKAGETDLNGLLMIVADRFQQLGSRVLQTAEARELFGRGGADLVKVLSQGSAGLHEMGEEAAQLGLVLSGQDKEANEAYRLSIHTLKAELEGFVVTMGREVLPALTGTLAHLVGYAQALKHSLDMPTSSLGWWTTFAGIVAEGEANAATFQQRMEALAKSLAKYGDGNHELVEGVKAGNSEWTGLADLLRQVKERTEDLSSVDAKTEQELARTLAAYDKVVKKYDELRAAGKLTKEDAAEEAAALAQMPAALSAMMGHFIDEINEKNAAAAEDLRTRIAAQGEQTLAAKSAAWDREIELRAEKLQKEGALTKENIELLFELYVAGAQRMDREQASVVEKAGQDLDQRLAAQHQKTYAEASAAWDREIELLGNNLLKEEAFNKANQDKLLALAVAGHAKIDAEHAATYAAEESKLDTHLESILARHTTHEQQLKAQYDKDVAAFGEAEEKKALLDARGDAERAATEQRFAAIRAALLQKYTGDLQALQNSQGWQGVFGSKFASMIKGNEALMKEWADSSNQSLMMVRVAMEGMKEMGQQAFDQLAQGMGANIAHAIMYKDSIGAAMKAALASTLENLAGQAIAYAIYSTALGFTRLAEYDPAGAASAFEAAAIWGSVGAASAVAGRVMTPAQAAATASAAADGSTASSSAAGAPGAGAAAGSGYNLTVIVQGNAYTVDPLIDAINEAVTQRDKALTATNTTTGQVVYR